MDTQKDYRCAIFSAAQTDVHALPLNNHERTLRIVIYCNVKTSGIQVRFSNQYGKTPLSIGVATLAICDAKGKLQPETLVPVTVDGLLKFIMEPEKEYLSDEIPFAIEPGQYFALSVYYPDTERVISGNWVGRNSYRSNEGNFAVDAVMPSAKLISRIAHTIIQTDMTVATTSVAQVIALCDEPHFVIGCFGDSVTQQGNWTSPLARLLADRMPGRISLCNLGISGNRLLANSPPSLGLRHGAAGVHRFEHDLLGLPGLTHAVLALGANDVGLPGSHDIPDDEVPTTEAYTGALTAMANALHERDVRVIAATITPRALDHPFDEGREAVRHEWNEWIRQADCFDDVLDFDNVMQRRDGRYGMPRDFALRDRLHPSIKGGMVMAKSIDLSIFEVNPYA